MCKKTVQNSFLYVKGASVNIHRGPILTYSVHTGTLHTNRGATVNRLH